MGTNATYRQLDQAGQPITNTGGTQGLTAFMSGAGNSFLEPETAVTKTLGFVYSPSFLPGFSGSLDWYNIRVKNRITGISAEYVANECYINGSADFCGVIKRDPVTGQISALSRGNANLGEMEAEGFDIALSYRLPRTQYGQFTIRNETSYVDTLRTRSSADSEWNNYAGEYLTNRVKSNTNLDWSLGNWSATWGMRYYSPVKDQCWDAEEGIECNMPNAKTTWGTGANKLGSLVYHDLSVGYKTSWDGRVLVGVNNFLNKKPRIVYNTQASAASVDADMPLDRFFYVRYTQSF